MRIRETCIRQKLCTQTRFHPVHSLSQQSPLALTQMANHPEIEPPQGYAGWKGRFLAHIDPDMGAFFYDGVKTSIRLEEAVWGGVPKDGIPDLINPPSIPAQDARYLNLTDRVFGVSINGEHRAYPLRILNPHEMANDVLGGVPFALAY